MLELRLSEAAPLPLNSNPLPQFLDRMHDRSFQDQRVSQTLFHRGHNLDEGAIQFHSNFLEYLKICWAKHRGIVVSPDILWYTLLGELGQAIAEHPDTFRPLFSRSEEKQDIILPADYLVIPLEDLLDALRPLVPTDVDTFLPWFSSTTDRSRRAMLAAFCDAVSPYFNHIMILCGFPAIRVLGIGEDWKTLRHQWGEVASVIQTLEDPIARDLAPWLTKTCSILEECAQSRENPAWWKGMFEIRHCGSGSQEELYGWITDLFRKPPGFRLLQNFSSGIAMIRYTNLNIGKNFCLKEGLFYSTEDGPFLVPEFGSILLEHREVASEPYRGWEGREAAIQRLLARAGEVSMPNPHPRR